MTTPKPTPREALSHLCWALTHGENADEDLRVLSAALEQLEWLRKQAEVFQDCNTGLARERDALRAENAALKAKLEEAVKPCTQCSRIHPAHHACTWADDKTLAQSRATALAARVEALETCLLSHSELPTGGPCSYWGKEEQSVLSSTPSDDLAAHDDRIRRETVERVLNDMGRSDLTPDELAAIYRAAGIKETK